MQTDTQVSHDLILLGIHLEECGVRIELGEFVRRAGLFLAVHLDRLGEFRLARQVAGEPLVITLAIVFEMSGSASRLTVVTRAIRRSG